jgi:hypothetical protein
MRVRKILVAERKEEGENPGESAHNSLRCPGSDLPFSIILYYSLEFIHSHIG